MHFALAALFFFAILTLWVPAAWPVTVFQVGIFLLAGIAVLRALRRPLLFSWPVVPLAFAVFWGLLQWLTGRTYYAFDTVTAIVRWTTFLAVLVIGIVVFANREQRHWFRAAMLWFAFSVAVLATLQTYTAGGRVFWIFPTPYTTDFMPPVPYRNHYAAFVEVVLPFALYEALRRDRGVLLYAGMSAALYASVIASASRTGTLLATAEILVMMTAMWRRGRASGRSVGLSLAGIVLLCAAFVAVVGPETVWARFQVPEPMRPQFAVASLHMIAAHPWFGEGMGTWPTVYPHYAVVDFGYFVNQAHSDWLQWAAEGGLPFALVMASLFVWTLRHAVRSLWALGVVSVFLHALVDYPFSRPALGAWPILVLAMLAAQSQADRPNSPNPNP